MEKKITQQPPPWPCGIGEENQAPKLLLVTAVVDMVIFLNLWAMKWSRFIPFVILNTISVAAKCI